ncbi:peptidase C39 family protein [Actinoplanes sp. HUAS TT8]|uniref:peptidase C39 family protein n=1 Tax=Actinoplanes sp. HUAS TT8 TaxID=3447453 RepID=UPI003F528FAA
MRITANPATALPAVVPAATLERWRRHGGVQEAVLWTGEDDSGLVTAAVEVHRPLTAYRLILDLWEVDGRGDELVAAIEHAAWEAGAAGVKRWFPAAGGQAWERSLARGYEEVAVPRWSGPVAGPHHRDPGAGQVKWRSAPARRVPYLRQTTDFTCGPAALLMGLAALGLRGEPTRDDEIRLWRSANTIGGSEPLGLALAALGEGAVARVSLSTSASTLLELCGTDEERDLRGFIQSGFRTDLAAANADVRTEAFTIADVQAILDAGGVSLVLIEQFGMHASSCPHWILVHSHRDGILYANDPWTDADLGETYLDGLDLPLPALTLDGLAWYGRPAYRGLLALSPPR